MFALAVLFSLITNCDASVNTLFPVPKTIEFALNQKQPQLALAPDFAVVVAEGIECDVLSSAASRYTTMIQKAMMPPAAGTTLIHTLVLASKDTTATLAPGVSVAYTLTVGASVATASGSTSFGALYAVETFAQFVEGEASFAAVTITDEPEFEHRGLTVDSGRRYAPIPLVKSIIDGLSYTKMNVLHLGITGPAVRVEIAALPELTEHLEVGQFYTAGEVADIISYARLRGVRIVPEFDVPAHASGLWPLAGTRALQFCDDHRTTLRGDDATTIGLVNEIFDAIVALFPDEVVHVGGDETCPHGLCPDACTFAAVNNAERAFQKRLVETHKRRPMGWNEIWSEGAATPNGALPELIIQNWKGAGDAETVDAGFATGEVFFITAYN